jgi:hypothetical protein
MSSDPRRWSPSWAPKVRKRRTRRSASPPSLSLGRWGQAIVASCCVDRRSGIGQDITNTSQTNHLGKPRLLPFRSLRTIDLQILLTGREVPRTRLRRPLQSNSMTGSMQALALRRHACRKRTAGKCNVHAHCTEVAARFSVNVSGPDRERGCASFALFYFGQHPAMRACWWCHRSQLQSDADQRRPEDPSAPSACCG